MVVVLAGLPGTGKSTLAAALAPALPGAVLDKDVIRAVLFPEQLVEYSARQDDFCQEVMLRTAAYLLGQDRSLNIILDGRTFSQRYQRDRVIQFCEQVRTPWAMIECVCAEQTALERLEDDVARRTHLAANRTPELYRRIRDLWEPVEEPKLVVDTDAGLDACVEQVLSYLRVHAG